MSSHDDHEMHRNSLDAFRREHRGLGERAVIIFHLLACAKAPMTDRAVMQSLGFSDMNMVRPRITELVKSKYLEEMRTRSRSSNAPVGKIGAREGGNGATGAARRFILSAFPWFGGNLKANI